MKKAMKPPADPPALLLRCLFSSLAPSRAAAAPLVWPGRRCRGSDSTIHHCWLPVPFILGRGRAVRAGPDLLVPCVGQFLSSSQLSRSSSESQRHAGSRVIPAIGEKDLQPLVASQCSSGLVGMSW